MIYPLEKCQTQPRITMSDITLRNITSHGNLLSAGIIRCNATNPCKNFNFEDVKVHSLLWDTINVGYISEYVEGWETNDYPDPKFKPEGYYDQWLSVGELPPEEDGSADVKYWLTMFLSLFSAIVEQFAFSEKDMGYTGFYSLLDSM